MKGGEEGIYSCNECSYTSDKLDNLAKHVALGHSRLDTLLQDDDLVAQKREIVMNKPKKINIGPTCPVCDLTFTKSQNRDHVAWHFMDEFREFVHSTGNEKACQLCYYTTEKPDNLVSCLLFMTEHLLNPDCNSKKNCNTTKTSQTCSCETFAFVKTILTQKQKSIYLILLMK